MKSRLTAFAALSFLALAVSACGASAGKGYGTTSGVPNTGRYGATAAPAATSMSAAATVVATVAATEMPKTGVSAAQVMVTSNPKFGSILTDAQGRTLYLLTKDGNNKPTCYADCAQLWPPLLGNAATIVGTGLDASKLGTAPRTFGATQITINGHPLYYFAQDMKPGDTNGQGYGGVWFVVSQTGDPVH